MRRGNLELILKYLQIITFDIFLSRILITVEYSVSSYQSISGTEPKLKEIKMEIERKFLLESIYKYPYNNLKFIKAYSILQGYFLNDEKYEFRIRLIKNNNKFEKSFLTIKSKDCLLSREEYEFTLNINEAFDYLKK